MIKLSIITINYNNVEGLKKTVESVVNQIWQEFEFIVIDGGSTDGSKDYIESQHSIIDYWISEKDSGIYHAMNKGIKIAAGEYLLFLNSGDHFFDEEVLNQYHFNLKHYDLIYFDINVVSKEKQFVKEYPEKLSFSYFLKDTLPHPATFIKRKIIEDYGGYDENLKIVSDWKFFIDSICKVNVTYKKVKGVVASFYLDGLSSDPANNSIILSEKTAVLKTDYPMFINDFESEKKYNAALKVIKENLIIRLLIKFGLINKF